MFPGNKASASCTVHWTSLQLQRVATTLHSRNICNYSNMLLIIKRTCFLMSACYSRQAITRPTDDTCKKRTDQTIRTIIFRKSVSLQISYFRVRRRLSRQKSWSRRSTSWGRISMFCSNAKKSSHLLCVPPAYMQVAHFVIAHEWMNELLYRLHRPSLSLLVRQKLENRLTRERGKSYFTSPDWTVFSHTSEILLDPTLEAYHVIQLENLKDSLKIYKGLISWICFSFFVDGALYDFYFRMTYINFILWVDSIVKFNDITKNKLLPVTTWTTLWLFLLSLHFTTITCVENSPHILTSIQIQVASSKSTPELSGLGRKVYNLKPLSDDFSLAMGAMEDLRNCHKVSDEN